jgi:3-deoxy-D-manno-octulosonate 8-phosphate phosphatase (KDO 8-P phosphatase)
MKEPGGMAEKIKKELREKIKMVRFLGFDVDGVLTDGNVYYGSDGSETKQFNTKDGLGIERAIKAGFTVALVSGRNSKAVSFRAKELGIKLVKQGVKDKKAVLNSLLKTNHFKKSEAAFMGDDLPDLKLKESVSLFVCPSDAVSEVKENAGFVTKAKGGKGAAREWIDLVLSLRNRV